jgi:hypothetical protein
MILSVVYRPVNGRNDDVKPTGRHLRAARLIAQEDCRCLSSPVALPFGLAALASMRGARLALSADAVLPSRNDGPARHAIIGFVNDGPGQPEIRTAGRAHRGLRSGRHVVGRAQFLYASRLLLRSRAGGREGEARLRERRAFQDRALRRSAAIAKLSMDDLFKILGATLLRVPKDILVAGFDDIPMASWAAYDLTTFVSRS